MGTGKKLCHNSKVMINIVKEYEQNIDVITGVEQKGLLLHFFEIILISIAESQFESPHHSSQRWIRTKNIFPGGK